MPTLKQVGQEYVRLPRFLTVLSPVEQMPHVAIPVSRYLTWGSSCDVRRAGSVNRAWQPVHVVWSRIAGHSPGPTTWPRWTRKPATVGEVTIRLTRVRSHEPPRGAGIPRALKSRAIAYGASPSSTR